MLEKKSNDRYDNTKGLFGIAVAVAVEVEKTEFQKKCFFCGSKKTVKCLVKTVVELEVEKKAVLGVWLPNFTNYF